MEFGISQMMCLHGNCIHFTLSIGLLTTVPLLGQLQILDYSKPDDVHAW